MIKLTNINKYYNKNRINQNHVCNNINLEINKTGLVVLLGKSGSGKTTLLNILSGMDKFDSGTLEFDGEIFQKYNSKKWDTLRKNKIGYIYQNYHLLKELSVYENIELVLKMYGMTDEDEIRNRVELLLESVGLKEYGDRLIKQLSGGQQQRIAFARALSKDPKVILADEPTGNLDSKTTIELMEILKRISETKLVIMVTHEQKLADFYADRIIEIDKGKVIIDKENTQKKDLNLLQEQIIYLKDYQKREIDDKTLKVTRYDRESDPELDLSVDLINRNDTLYVNVDADKPIKLKFINRDTEIEVLDETIKNIKQKEPIKIGPINQRVSNEKRSAITFKDAFHYALRKMNVLTFSDKLLYSILLLVGMIMSVSIGMIGETNRVDQTVSEQNRNYVTITTDKIPYEDIIAFEDIESIDQIMFINQKVSFNITSEKYYEVNSSIRLRALPVDIRFLDDSKIIYGEMPEGYGVVIDKSIADNLIRDYDVRGIGNYDDILKCSFKLQASGSDSDLPHDNALYFPITGIAKDYSESIWMSDELMYSIVTPTLIDHQILEDHFVITEGTLPPSFREVMLHEESPFLDQGAAPYSIGITTGEYFISGVYKYTKQDTDFNLQNLIVTTEDYLRHEYFA